MPITAAKVLKPHFSWQKIYTPLQVIQIKECYISLDPYLRNAGNIAYCLSAGWYSAHTSCYFPWGKRSYRGIPATAYWQTTGIQRGTPWVSPPPHEIYRQQVFIQRGAPLPPPPPIKTDTRVLYRPEIPQTGVCPILYTANQHLIIQNRCWVYSVNS